jgi:hypothetical protein
MLGDFAEYRNTAKNSGKQRAIPLLFWRAALRNPRISAENGTTLAVNFREEQRKQRGWPSHHFAPKQCSGPGKRRARTSAAYSTAAAAILRLQPYQEFFGNSLQICCTLSSSQFSTQLPLAGLAVGAKPASFRAWQ